MSDNWIIFAPRDPDWVPADPDRVSAARAVLETAFPVSDGTEATTFDHYSFIWNGANFEGVFCPFCGKSAEDWWADSIPHFDERSSFDDLKLVTPCCAKPTTLNDLDYPNPVAFARFELSVMNPCVPTVSAGVAISDLPADLVPRLQQQLGTDLIVVRRHL